MVRTKSVTTEHLTFADTNPRSNCLSTTSDSICNRKRRCFRFLHANSNGDTDCLASGIPKSGAKGGVCDR